MGFDYESTEAMTGAIFTGAGTSMSTVWFLIAAALCVVAILAGNRHEHASYKKLKK